jgi:molecular chaperone GrpE
VAHRNDDKNDNIEDQDDLDNESVPDSIANGATRNGAAQGNGVEVVPTELEQSNKDRDKWKSDFLYLKAEFDNYKRNAIKERAETLKYGSERVIVDFLQIMDNLDRALQMDINEKNVASFRKGMEMVATEMRAILQRLGVTDIPSEGVPFDPNIHEALTSEDSTSVPAGHVTQVFRKPYKLHDKVIRTGQVVVAREPGN